MGVVLRRNAQGRFVANECKWHDLISNASYRLSLYLVTPGFKNKTRYTPYVSSGSQISHIATNKGNIKI